MRLSVLLATLSMVVGACGGGTVTSTAPADPASATTCEELADAMVAINQELIDQVGDMSLEEFTAAGGPLAFEDWVAKAQLAASQTVELGCEAIMEGMLAERADRLEAKGPAGESLVADFKSNVSGG